MHVEKCTAAASDPRGVPLFELRWLHRYDKRVLCEVPGQDRMQLVVCWGTGNCNRILLCGKREEERARHAVAWRCTMRDMARMSRKNDEMSKKNDNDKRGMNELGRTMILQYNPFF